MVTGPSSKNFPTGLKPPIGRPTGNGCYTTAKESFTAFPPTSSAEPELINTGFAQNCNNDHVLSADGQQIAISHGTKEDYKSRIYTLPITGGTPPF